MASKPVAKTMASSVVLRAARRARPSGVIASIGVVAQVDQRDVVAVERLVVAGVDAQPLACRWGSPAARAARRPPGRATISRILRAHELGGGVVGLLSSSRSVKAPRNARPPCCQRSSYSRSRSSGVTSSAETSLRSDDRSRRADLARLRAGTRRSRPSRSRSYSGSSGALCAGTREVRRALEDVQVRGLLGDDRDRLDRRRAGADDADPLAGEVDALVRPVAGVVPVGPRSVSRPGNVGHVAATTGSRSP